MPREETDITETDSCRIAPLSDPDENAGTPLSRLDALDIFALAGILLLTVVVLAIIVHQLSQPPTPEQLVKQKMGNVIVVSPELDQKKQLVKKLISNGNLDQAGEVIAELVQQFPYDGLLYMFLGDIRLREQAPVSAMFEYRRGVDLNPDFLDRKTAVFQGKKIKNTLEEAREAIESGLSKNPDDRQLQEAREVLYYMLRKVAGSCG